MGEGRLHARKEGLKFFNQLRINSDYPQVRSLKLNYMNLLKFD
jgi:hypothetical protein